MKKRFKYFAVLAALIMVLSLSACGGNDEEPAAEADAAWGDQYTALLDSGEARDYEGYEDIKATLDTIKEDTGATYVYALTPLADGEISIDGDASKAFAITVDAGDDPDDWGLEYDWEIQFTEAWEGEPAAARSAWNEDETMQCWSAFAPVYNSDGKVVCILGIDYPCTEVIADYPEWNRDNDAWNGYTDEITGEIPEAIQTQMDEVIAIADENAKELSAK